MQNNNIDMQTISDESQFAAPTKKTPKVRKWREIEAIKARYQLSKELQDIDQSFGLSVKDFF